MKSCIEGLDFASLIQWLSAEERRRFGWSFRRFPWYYLKVRIESEQPIKLYLSCSQQWTTAGHYLDKVLDDSTIKCGPTTYATQMFQPDAPPHAPLPESQLGLVEFHPVFELGLVPGPRPPHWSLPPPHVPVCPPPGLEYGLLLLFGLVATCAPHPWAVGCMPI